MADIRINALATTAASTASDDFVAVDGSANGTRKLNAYSPTFGGNLTVSGGTLAVTPSANDATATLKGRATGTNQLATSSRGSNVTLVNLDTTDNNCEAIAFQNSNELAIASIVAQNVSHTGRTGKLYVNISNGAAPAEALNIAADKTVTLAGNLTVSGTGNSSVAGTLLVATTTNSSNGKIQLADHTTSAGGIGFGTDLSLYRSNSDALTSYSSGTANNFFLRHSTTAAGGFQVQIDSSKDVYLFQRENRPMYIGTNNTTALTLDASRNATFEGNVTLSNSGNAFFNLRYGSGGFGMVEFTRNSVNKGRIYQNSSDELFIESATANQAIKLVGTAATFAGAIAIGNTVNTVSPTSPNRTITMVIGGTTYYIHAKTTND